MSFTSEHGRSVGKKMRQLKNDKGTLIQTQEENQALVTAPQPFPGEGTSADGSLPKRDTSKDTDINGKVISPSKHADTELTTLDEPTTTTLVHENTFGKESKTEAEIEAEAELERERVSPL